jgi:hypothetical protein
MLHDVLGSLVAVAAFAAVLYAPGYVVAYAADLFGFRQMGFPDRSLWAMACSFCVAPISAYLVGRSAGLGGICWIFGISSAVALLLLALRSHRTGWSRRDRWVTALLACGWIAFVLLMLVDVQTGNKLYFSVVMADQSYRIAFTDAVVRTGVPPANPLYFAGAPAPMHYYYFWYVLCAAVVKLAHVSARQSFIASSIWAGFGLLATVKLYTRHFFRWERRQRWIALGLLFVTGADLLPAVGNAILQPTLNGDIEWWSVDPIDAWPDSLLWVPHHTASVLCCLLAFLFLWRTRESISRSSRQWAVALAAMAFASAFGLSVYVAFGFALLMLAWLLRLAVLRHAERSRITWRVAVAGTISALLLSPFLWELAAGHANTAVAIGSHGSSPATHLFSISVRRFIDSGLLTGLPIFAVWNHSHPVLLDQSIRLMLLLPGLAMELGLYGAVLVLLLLQKRGQPMQDEDAIQTSLFFVLSGLLVTIFLSSSVITNNDFGYRAVMLPQFFLTLLAADVLGSWWTPGSAQVVTATPFRRRLLYSLLALGVAGSVYGAVLLRAWLPIESAKSQSSFRDLPQDAFETREAFAALDHVASINAVVAFHAMDAPLDRHGEVITAGEFDQRIKVMDTGRQMLNAERECATQFGGDPSQCPAIQQASLQLYASPPPSADWARDYCRRFGVQYLVISHHDPSWGSSTGWPATLPLVAQEPDLKILQCADDSRR